MKNLHDPEGTVRADLVIALPVGIGSVGRQVDVKLNFDDAAAKAPAWGVELSHIDGNLQITDQDITGNGIRAQFYRDPVVVNISTDHKSEKTMIKVDGFLESRQLLSLLPEYLTRGFTGSSKWDVGIGIANGKSNKAIPTVQIDATSKLENTTILFPKPFSKPDHTSRPITAGVSIFKDGFIDFNLLYGSDFKAKGQLKLDPDNIYRLSVLGLGFATEYRPLPSTGIKIYGSLPNFPLDEWIKYYRSHLASDSTITGETLRLIDTVDLNIKTVSFYGSEFTDNDLLMIRSARGYTGTIESSLLKGNIYFPVRYSPENPVIADLEYLKIQSRDDESQSTGLLPRDLVNLKLLSKSMSYGDYLVSNFSLDTRVEGNLFIINRLAFQHDKVYLNANAQWQYLDEIKQHRSSLNLSLNGEELGQTIAALGFGDTLHDGKINLDGQIKWSGELLNMDWESLAGGAKLKLTDGVLKDVEPGSGRLVGLLSLSALPRRLALDFSDVLFDGLAFDKIAGSYQFRGENLYIVNTKMEGVSADVKISGRIGLRQRDYDQTMLVIPQIRHTLPLLGGLAAGSAVGWGLLLLQNLFKKAIDKSVEIEYKVTGSWENPQVDLVKKTVIKSEREPYEE